MNSAKLGSRTPPLSLNEPPATDRASFDEALIAVNRRFRVENSRLRILFTVKNSEQLRLDKRDGQHWGEIDLYVEHGIDEAELVTHLPLPEPENVDDIQEDVEEDPGVGTQVDNGPSVVSQAENDQVQYSGGEFSDEEADLESNQEDGDSDLERSPLHEAGFVDVECGNAENRDEEIRFAICRNKTVKQNLI
nr:uncharacterized protein LOC109164765 [Ipomoea batatas]